MIALGIFLTVLLVIAYTAVAITGRQLARYEQSDGHVRACSWCRHTLPEDDDRPVCPACLGKDTPAPKDAA